MRQRFVDCVWNVMAQAQKPDFVFRWNGRVHLNRQGRQFSRLLAAEVCASAIVMLDTPCSEVVWRVLATHSIRQFPLHFPTRASPCAITFQLDSTEGWCQFLKERLIVPVNMLNASETGGRLPRSSGLCSASLRDGSVGHFGLVVGYADRLF